MWLSKLRWPLAKKTWLKFRNRLSSGEFLANVENIVSNGNTSSNAVTARRPLVAQRIAQDLFNFMLSFDTGAGGGSNPVMVVPKNIFERWWTRFESKSKRDPNFFLKQQD